MALPDPDLRPAPRRFWGPLFTWLAVAVVLAYFILLWLAGP